MKKPVLCAVLFIFVCAGFAGAEQCAQQHAAISFTYQKQKGFSSNQFAVWVENAEGSVVKTLYVTSFTPKKGWRTRPDSLREWVALTKPGKDSIDAASGATPKSGKCTYLWDFTNAAGARVAPGTYTIKVEATLYKDYYMIAAADVMVDQSGCARAGSVPADIRVHEPSDSGDKKNGSMISGITVTVQ